MMMVSIIMIIITYKNIMIIITTLKIEIMMIMVFEVLKLTTLSVHIEIKMSYGNASLFSERKMINDSHGNQIALSKLLLPHEYKQFIGIYLI